MPSGLSLDGNSLVPLLLAKKKKVGKRKKKKKKSAIDSLRGSFWTSGKNSAARDGNWKLTIVDGKTSFLT
ncbi:MAG: hypothetical protein IPK78_07850 [Rhodospirillales bacterium]|nr:hypothetical protein [Rhodospirillales bacterium]